jgi:hypothetical protein
LATPATLQPLGHASLAQNLANRAQSCRPLCVDENLDVPGVPSLPAPTPLLPSRTRTRHHTLTLSLPMTWLLVHYNARGQYRTPSTTKPSPPFPHAPARASFPFRLC